jgi:uncharacterized protein (DUF1015 family)
LNRFGDDISPLHRRVNRTPSDRQRVSRWRHADAWFAYGRGTAQPSRLAACEGIGQGGVAAYTERRDTSTTVPTVLPFAGLRYAAPPAELDLLLSPPYDVIDAQEQARLQALSANNASYVELPADAPGEPGSRYRLAARHLAAWRHQRVLVPDARPAYYLSETHFGYLGHSLRRRDVLAALGVEPWSTGAVLPHEHTMAGPKLDRLQLLRATHLNVSPIWVMHRQRLPALDQAWRLAEARPPAVEFTWRDERHRLWIVDDPEMTGAIARAFADGGPLYIADGHHRYETSLAFRAEAEASLPGASATLAALTWADDPGLLALPTHRLLRTLGATVSLEDVVRGWKTLFDIDYYPVEDCGQADALVQRLADSGRSRPSFGVYGLGDRRQFALLRLRGGSPPDAALPADRSPAWKALDVSLLHALLVDPLVAKAGQPRDEVLSYTRYPEAALTAVRDGQARLAFLLNATPVKDVLAVADAHDRMPEKSTYFYPKPPAGVVMRDLEAA